MKPPDTAKASAVEERSLAVQRISEDNLRFWVWTYPMSFDKVLDM
ncbi:hypothetical protein HanIR_Chr05g0237921 [Helianthus annuus]|nr:hypothetical protein HanIR_Chr05g0237921 [Helianthus annuus]